MKHFFIIIIIIIAAITVLYFFSDQIGWNTTYEQVNPTAPAVSGNQTNGPSGQPTTINPAPKKASQDVVTIASTFSALAQDFDPYVPLEISRIWMQDEVHFYVEYKNQRADLAQILVVKENGSFKGIGYFAPTEAGWELQAGEGELIQPNAVYYEKDAKGNWLRKN